MSNDEQFLVLAPPNQVAQAMALYVIVSVDDNGEGVCAVSSPVGMLPAVFIKPDIVQLALAALRKVLPRRKLRVLKFSTREVLQEVDT